MPYDIYVKLLECHIYALPEHLYNSKNLPNLILPLLIDLSWPISLNHNQVSKLIEKRVSKGNLLLCVEYVFSPSHFLTYICYYPFRLIKIN